ALLLILCRFAQDCAKTHGDREQAGGLAEDEIKMLVERDALAEFLHLQELAFDHLLREVDQFVENLEVAFLDGDLESLHIKPVTGENALGVAPLRVGRRTAAASWSFVDDVIVNQCGRVNDFYHAAEANGAALVMRKKLGGKQKQRRTDSLTAAGAQMFADLGD